MKYLSNLNISRAAIFFIFINLTSACATMNHKALKPELANQSYQIKVISIIPNDEITIQFDEKQYLSIGMVGKGYFWRLLTKLG